VLFAFLGETMIAYVEGILLKKDAKGVVVFIHGIGLSVQLAKPDIDRLGLIGQPVALHIHTQLKEDGIGLFGFMHENDLLLFEEVIQVSGIGPKLALTLLSGMDAADIQRAVLTEDVKALTCISGIGKKTAERMVFELKDKLARLSLPGSDAPLSQNKQLEDLRSALTHLGFKNPSIEKAISNMDAGQFKNRPLEMLLQEALKYVD
jgi:Holliday junction DNA helicase RuvA